MKKIRVMLIDDSKMFLYAAIALLATVPEAEVVSTATSAATALDEISSAAPDLILMDYSMPGMNGIDAVRLISADPSAPLVMLVSMHDSPEYRSAAIANGALGLIPKSKFGIEIPDLIASLAKSGS